MKKIDLTRFAASINQGDFVHLFIGVLLGVVFNLVKFLKWHRLIQGSHFVARYWESAKSYMIGNALGIITPMRAGDLGRALYFKSQDRARIMGYTIIDRLLDLTAVICFSVAGGVVLINGTFGCALAMLCILAFVIVYSPMQIRRLPKKVLSSTFLYEKLGKLVHALDDLDMRLITGLFVLSFLSFFLIILQFYFVISAFENTVFLTVYLATPLVTLSSLIPISFMGLGVREGLSVYLFSMMGISPETAFSTAFLCFVINNVSTSSLGAIYLSTINSSK